MFSQKEAIALEINKFNLGRRCHPIIDILPDGNAVPCYPLAEASGQRITPELDAQKIKEIFAKKLEKYKIFGIFRECRLCRLHTAGKCVGGCTASALRRMRKIL